MKRIPVAPKHGLAANIRGERMIAARRLGTHTESEWYAMVIYHHNRCAKCYGWKPVTLDHIMPVAFGGSDGIDNLQPLCMPCNRQNRYQRQDWRRAGWREAVNTISSICGSEEDQLGHYLSVAEKEAMRGIGNWLD